MKFGDYTLNISDIMVCDPYVTEEEICDIFKSSKDLTVGSIYHKNIALDLKIDILTSQSILPDELIIKLIEDLKDKLLLDYKKYQYFKPHVSVIIETLIASGNYATLGSGIVAQLLDVDTNLTMERFSEALRIYGNIVETYNKMKIICPLNYDIFLYEYTTCFNRYKTNQTYLTAMLGTYMEMEMT